MTAAHHLPSTAAAASFGDAAGFHAAYREHHASVSRVAYGVVHDRVLAEDIAQEVFLALWRRPERFDARRGDLGPYLRMVARSRALDAWRASRCGARAQEKLIDRERGERPDGHEAADAAEHRARSLEVRAAVRRLPHAQREAVALAYWGEMPASEVAARTAVPLGTAKSRLRLGLTRLRADLGEPARAYSGTGA